MIAVQEFLMRTRLEYQVVEHWISAGWLMPQQEPELAFSEVDLARARLIAELKHDLGVNDEGIAVILHLLDQIHGLRGSMRELIEEVHRSRRG